MKCTRSTSRPVTMVCALALALPVSMASAAPYAVDWLSFAPTPFGAAPATFTTPYTAPAGLGAVSIGYWPPAGTVFQRQAVTAPSLQNASFASGGDTYGWGAQESLGITYSTGYTPNIPYVVNFFFSSPLPANQQLVLGVLGLGKRTPVYTEPAALNRTLVTVNVPQGDVTYLGEYQPAGWGNTLFTGSATQFTLENAQTAPGMTGPHWNSGLALVRFDKPLVGNVLTVQIEQTAGDGIGLNVGFLQAVPEPSTYALFGFGLAGLGLLRWRRSLAHANRTT